MNIGNIIDYVDMKRKLKEDKKYIFNLNIACFLMCTSTLLLLWLLTSMYFFNGSPEIVVLNRTDDVDSYVSSLLDRIDTKYLNLTKKMIFTTDEGYLNNNKNRLCCGQRYVGMNKLLKREITVYLQFDEKVDLETICHELLHNIIRTADDEYFVYDIAEMNPCLRELKLR